MLHLVCGVAHSKKTALMQQILWQTAKAKRHATLIVPEQASFANERLISSLPNELAEHIRVLSFSRLSELLLRQLGGLDRELLDETASAFLVSVALEELGDELTVYRRHYRSRGFIGQIAGMLSECENAGVTPEALSSFALSQPEGSLRQKSHELALIFDVYRAVLSRSYLSPTDLLTLAAEKLASSDLFCGEEILIDDFGSFTAPELSLIEVLLQKAARVSVALCCDVPDSSEPAFALACDTVARLSVLAKHCHCEIVHTVLAVPEAHGSLSLFERATRAERLLEREGEPDGQVQVVAASDPSSEVVQVAAQIAKLVREEDFRYREIAVIVRDITRYRSLLPSVFARYEIPSFLDLRSDACSSALTQGVLMAFAIAAGLREGDFLSLAASPLLGLDAQALGSLESYCYVWSIRGRSRETPFTRHPDGMVGEMDEAAIERLSALEALRQQVIKPIAPLREAIKSAEPRQIARGIWQFLQSCDAKEQLAVFAEPMPPQERRLFLEEQSLLWDQLVRVLDLFAAMPEEVSLSAERAYELLELSVGGFAVATVPRSLDEVLVGTADRMRPENPRIVFLLGAIEGEFPSSAMPGGLFSEEERHRMAQSGLPFVVDGDRSAATERMFCYRAVTAATERVVVSYPAADLSGEQLVASELYLRAAALAVPVSRPAFDTVQTAASLEVALASLGGEATPTSAQRAAVQVAGQRLLGELRCQRLLDAAKKPAHQLKNPALAKQLFGMRLRLSPTRLEQFYRCPFSYYMNRGLGAKALQRAELSPAQAGTLIHRVLESAVSQFGGDGLSTAPEETLRTAIAEETAGYLTERLGDLSTAPKRLLGGFQRIGEWLYELLRRIGEELCQSSFTPVAYELSIGEAGSVSPLILQTADGGEILVEGTVDRVDVATIDGKRYVRVLDYKSGQKKFRLDDLYYGLNMQMLVYLFSICQNGQGELSRLLPAGALYLPALGGYLSSERDAEEQAVLSERREQYRMNGLLLADSEVLRAMEGELEGLYIPYADGKKADSLYSLTEMGRLRRLVEERLCSMAELLHQGEIAARPSCRGSESPCGYCDYRGVCGFEEGDAIRELATLDRNAVLNALQEEVEEQWETE